METISSLFFLHKVVIIEDIVICIHVSKAEDFLKQSAEHRLATTPHLKEKKNQYGVNISK